MWLLVGGDSQIGAATSRYAVSMGRSALATTRRVDRVGPTRPLLDLSRPLDDWLPPAGVEAACIFAAQARLAACQADPLQSALINVAQAQAVTQRLLAHGAQVLFLSTNQVFDGNRPRVPSDAQTSPVSEYGRQKARAEALLLKLAEQGGQIAILRLSKVISPGMHILHAWLDALSAGKPVRAFRDMMLAPIPMTVAVKGITALLADRACGTFQLTGAADVAYADIALHLAKRIGAPAMLVEPVAAASAGMPTGSTPRNTTLDSATMRDRYGIVVPDIWPIVDAVIEDWRASTIHRM